MTTATAVPSTGDTPPPVPEPPAIPEAVLAHRGDYWTWVELHAAEPDRTRLLRLRDHWHQVNAEHFAGAMTLPYITLTEPSKPSIYGQCCAVSSWGSRLEIKIRPSLMSGTHPHLDQTAPIEGRWRFVLDVLLHEAVHQYHREVTGRTEPAYHGHGPAFTETANRIGTTLGLPPVIAKNRGGTKRRDVAPQWPHCVRDCGYYLSAYRVPATGDSPGEVKWDDGVSRILDLSETGLLADGLVLGDIYSDDEGESLAHCPLVKKFYTSLGRFGVTMVMV
jgi:hypothetical protein